MVSNKKIPLISNECSFALYGIPVQIPTGSNCAFRFRTLHICIFSFHFIPEDKWKVENEMKSFGRVCKQQTRSPPQSRSTYFMLCLNRPFSEVNIKEQHASHTFEFFPRIVKGEK